VDPSHRGENPRMNWVPSDTHLPGAASPDSRSRLGCYLRRPARYLSAHSHSSGIPSTLPLPDNAGGRVRQQKRLKNGLG